MYLQKSRVPKTLSRRKGKGNHKAGALGDNRPPPTAAHNLPKRGLNLFPVCRSRRDPPRPTTARSLPYTPLPDLFLGRPLFQLFPVVHPRCDGRLLFSISFSRFHRSPSFIRFCRSVHAVRHPTSPSGRGYPVRQKRRSFPGSVQLDSHPVGVVKLPPMQNSRDMVPSTLKPSDRYNADRPLVVHPNPQIDLSNLAGLTGPLKQALEQQPPDRHPPILFADAHAKFAGMSVAVPLPRLKLEDAADLRPPRRSNTDGRRIGRIVPATRAVRPMTDEIPPVQASDNRTRR